MNNINEIVDKYASKEEEAEYKELDVVAMKIAKDVGNAVNKAARSSKVKTPYISQYILEEVISILQESV